MRKEKWEEKLIQENRNGICCHHSNISPGSRQPTTIILSTSTELVALTEACKLMKDKEATIHTDSQYAYATCHVKPIEMANSSQTITKIDCNMQMDSGHRKTG